MRAPADRPNVILINCDDLGYGDVGPYGSTLNATPHLDRMAREGTRFTDFYMAAPVCSPSRGAMMTGCYPRRIGFGSFEGQWVLFPGQGVGLNPSEITVASILRAQGYATRLVGKWHCGDQPEFLPTRHGFDGYYGLPYSNDMGIQTGRSAYPPLPLMRDESVVQEQPDQAGLTERYVEDARLFMRAHRDRPFFLYLAHTYVHVPLFVQDRFARESRNGLYGAAVACVDWSVGMVMHELRTLGLDANTLVLFTSDNGSSARGGGSNAPLRGSKGTTWEGGMRLPLIARWPGQVPAGGTCGEVATSMDLLPTLAALAGGRAPGDRVIDGRDIGPLLRGEAGARSPHDAFFYYFTDQLDAVRRGRWKLFCGRFDRKARQRVDGTELYDLAGDVGETTNVADAHPDIVRDLRARLDACRGDLGDGATGAAGANCRPIGRVADPKPLTVRTADYPYVEALYDLTDRM